MKIKKSFKKIRPVKYKYKYKGLVEGYRVVLINGRITNPKANDNLIYPIYPLEIAIQECNILFNCLVVKKTEELRIEECKNGKSKTYFVLIKDGKQVNEKLSFKEKRVKS